MQDVIPQGVFREVQAHLREGAAHAEGGWEAGSDEEDTLTGDFGASVRTPGWVESRDDGARWQWRITYKKLRGRGRDAPEKVIGADGIFQIEVRPFGTSVVIPKGILFQAKKYQGSSRSDLIPQVEDMERVAPGASAVFEFGPNGYFGVSGREILVTRQLDPDRVPHPERRLGSYLADEFLPCEAGLRGMYYDPFRGNLFVPLAGGEVRVVQISVRHRIALQVVSERSRGSRPRSS